MLVCRRCGSVDGTEHDYACTYRTDREAVYVPYEQWRANVYSTSLADLGIDPGPTVQPLINFTSGTTSSKIPRFDLIPYKAQLRLAKRFELGLEKHKEKSWNARSKQDALTDEEFIIARASHVIHHAMKLIAKRTGQLPPDEDDDAAAIAWGGIFLCEATEPKIDDTVIVSRKLIEAGHLRMCTVETGVCICAKLLDEAQARIDKVSKK